MPTYTYRGLECKHEIEVQQRISDDPLTECPRCKKPTKRVIVSGNFILKGEKWYKTSKEY